MTLTGRRTTAVRCRADRRRFIGYSEAPYDQVLDAKGASKLAPLYLVQVLAKEFGAPQITVNSVIPGAMRAAGVFSESGDDDLAVLALTARTQLGRLGTPEATPSVLPFLAGPDGSFVTGQHLTVDDGVAI